MLEYARDFHVPEGVKCVALFGEMGAGKTAFARGFCGEMAASPTFAIVNEYGTPRGKVFHFDWYRLSGAAELYDLGWEEYPDRGLCLVEWPERAPSVLPPETLKIHIAVLSENIREITIENTDV